MELRNLLADMTPGKLLTLLANHAKDYKAVVGTGGVVHNRHMNKYRGEQPSVDLVDAILTDFVNFVGTEWGLDFAMHARNLTDPKREP